MQIPPTPMDAAAPVPMPELKASSRWTPAQRIAFRFVFSYFALVFVPAWATDLLPFGDFLLRKYYVFWYAVVPWVGRHIVHTSYDLSPVEGGFGIDNTAFGMIKFSCYVALAALATLIWSVLDRRRGDYGRLHQWFRLLLRLTLATAMINYGALKVIPTQMPSPLPLGLLKQRIGDLAPMRLLWIFVGASPAYETFTGCAELLGGILLLIPRTVLLGGLVCFADMVMVVMLNLCYDVHVKLYSLHLLFMAALLIAPDLPRLADLFLFNRRVEPAEVPPLFARKWLDRAPQILLLLFGLYRIGSSFDNAYKRYQPFHPPRPPLYGVWSVAEFAVDGKDVPLFTDAQRWRWVTFQGPRVLAVELMIGSRRWYTLDLDPKNKKMILGKALPDAQGGVLRDAAGRPRQEPGWRADLSFAKPQADVLVLDGELDGHRLHARLNKMALLGDNFHWIWVPPKED